MIMQLVGSIPDSQKIVKVGSTDGLQNEKTMVPNEVNYELIKLIASLLQPIVQAASSVCRKRRILEGRSDSTGLLMFDPSSKPKG
ncbi:hypothetical protein A4A49_53083 [Nicotiana attenuata]|uniref:Uncharacterized protein n=1 Tax=Nicotiana attenuata TaxID=49451 RepID=A0A1J6JSG2_NICAT|nr:hypothetical protein A4A49_53083 [Nicotiana attenuata]